MTEIEKLEAGVEYCFDAPEVAARKERAIVNCRAYKTSTLLSSTSVRCGLVAM